MTITFFDTMRECAEEYQASKAANNAAPKANIIRLIQEVRGMASRESSLPLTIQMQQVMRAASMSPEEIGALFKEAAQQTIPADIG